MTGNQYEYTLISVSIDTLKLFNTYMSITHGSRVGIDILLNSEHPY